MLLIHRAYDNSGEFHIPWVIATSILWRCWPGAMLQCSLCHGNGQNPFISQWIMGLVWALWAKKNIHIHKLDILMRSRSLPQPRQRVYNQPAARCLAYLYWKDQHWPLKVQLRVKSVCNLLGPNSRQLQRLCLTDLKGESRHTFPHQTWCPAQCIAVFWMELLATSPLKTRHAHVCI